VWWTIFTAVDLYIGLIILDSLAGTIPPEKQKRLGMARKAILALLGATVIVLAVQIIHRH
jgi:cell division protein FtsL